MSSGLHDDRVLLQLLKDGDRNAFLLLYNRYHVALYAYALKFVKVPELAEDLLQEVFLKIWEIRERIDPSLSFTAYLYRITRNKVFRLMKKMAADEQLRIQALYHMHTMTDSSDTEAEWQRFEILLNQAIAQLPPRRQKIFRLCRQQGKKYEEVAQELSISRNTVKEHMVIAGKFIREYILAHTPLTLVCIMLLTDWYTRCSR